MSACSFCESCRVMQCCKMKPVKQVLMLKNETAEHYHVWTALSQTNLFLQVFCKAVLYRIKHLEFSSESLKNSAGRHILFFPLSLCISSSLCQIHLLDCVFTIKCSARGRNKHKWRQGLSPCLFKTSSIFAVTDETSISRNCTGALACKRNNVFSNLKIS